MNINDAKGFTLIEILTSLLLISLTFGLISSAVSTSRDRLDSTRQHIERAIAFSIDEATVRNALVRIHFVFDGEQQYISVENGESGNYMLPSFLFAEKQDLDKEELAEQNKKLQNQFSSVKDFQDGKFTLDEDIQIIAVATSVSKQLVTEGESAIYFYPTGEKDDAIIFFGSDEEIIVLKISAFILKISIDYLPLELIPNESATEKQLEMAKEIFEKWLKDK